MDVEKTIEFLLENQVRLQAMFEAEKDHVKEESGRAKEEAGRVKEEMSAIRQILQEITLIQREQARILVRIESQAERHKEEIADIRQILADLAGKLQALIESLRHGANGSGAKHRNRTLPKLDSKRKNRIGPPPRPSGVDPMRLAPGWGWDPASGCLDLNPLPNRNWRGPRPTSPPETAKQTTAT